jgi:hypothetical protein
MHNSSPWLNAPADAYRLGQQTEAAGADRRPFAERSITQHVAMFDRFLRHVIAHKADLATFSAAHLEAFSRTSTVAARLAPRRGSVTSS